MTQFIAEVGANPGRSAHRQSIEAARILYAAREAVARLFNAPDPLRVVFTANVTEALNLALYGWLRPGDQVITSGMEHNAVMRPLRDLEAQGVFVAVIPCSTQGALDPDDLRRAIRPETALICLNHASNVSGGLLPLREVGQIARDHGLPLLADLAQSGGLIPVDMEADGIDLLAFTGHKSLLGPMGTGGLILGPRIDLERLKPLRRGGTGSRSELETQPEFAPDRYESGTPNLPGLAGLAAGIAWLQGQGLDSIHAQEQALMAQLIAGLRDIPGLTIYGPPGVAGRTATLAFNLRGISPAEAGERLDEQAGILCRVGLHCAPAAHRSLGSFPEGSVRFSLSPFTTAAEITQAVEAVARLAREAAHA